MSQSEWAAKMNPPSANQSTSHTDDDDNDKSNKTKNNDNDNNNNSNDNKTKTNSNDNPSSEIWRKKRPRSWRVLRERPLFLAGKQSDS